MSQIAKQLSVNGKNNHYSKYDQNDTNILNVRRYYIH